MRAGNAPARDWSEICRVESSYGVAMNRAPKLPSRGRIVSCEWRPALASVSARRRAAVSASSGRFNAIFATPAANTEHLDHAVRGRRCVIMCAETVWWRCRRRLIADDLLAAGDSVFHIPGKSHVDAARLTPGAVVR